MSSLLHLHESGAADPGTRDALREASDRIRSMALVHERLYSSKNFSSIEFMEYIGLLWETLLSGRPELSGRVGFGKGPGSLSLDMETAVPLGLICNELIVNSLKYAFPGGRRGTVSVSLSGEPDGASVLTVRDDGVGLPPGVDFSRDESLGFQLVRAVAGQAGAMVSARSAAGGACFDIRFPASGRGSGKAASPYPRPPVTG